MPSLKKLIYDHIKNSDRPVSRIELEQKAYEWGYNAYNVDRRSQELAKDGQITRIPGKYASYAAIRIVEDDGLGTGEVHKDVMVNVHQGVEQPAGGQANLFPNLRRKTALETGNY